MRASITSTIRHVAESQYIMAGTRERATTLEVSSGGVFLKTETRLQVGKPIEVLIDWPVLLHERGALRLVMYGHVLRSDARGTAVQLVRSVQAAA